MAEQRIPGQQFTQTRYRDGWLVSVRDGVELLRFDEILRALTSLPIPTRMQAFFPSLAANDDGTLVAVTHRSGVRVYACSPQQSHVHLLWEARHDPWQEIEETGCTIDDSSRLWWVGPTSDQRTDRIVVLDGQSGDELAAGEVPREGYAYRVLLHPSGGAAIVESMAGQDPSLLWRVMFLGPHRLSVEQLPVDDRTMGGFSPDGMRFVTAPHVWGDPLCVHRWPDGAVLDALEPAAVFLDEDEAGHGAADGFDFQADFIDDGHVVVDTRQRRLLLLRTSPLVPVAELWPAGYAIIGYGDRGQAVLRPEDAYDYQGDLTSWMSAGARLLTGHADSRLCLWSLPPLA